MISKKLKTAGLLGLILVFAVTLAACDMGSTTSGTVEMDELNVNISGEGEVEPDQGEFDENASIEITAEPAEGWKFSHWEGNVAEEEAKSTVLMKGEREVTAVFNWDYSHLVEDGEVMSPGNKGRGRNILVVVNGRAQGRGVAYSSIQEAVDNAEEGYKILVTPGTYEETVEVETDDLTIKGVNEHNMPILTGDLYIFSEDVQVDNLDVKGDIIEAALVNNAEELEAALENEDVDTIIMADGIYVGLFTVQYPQTIKAENEHEAVIRNPYDVTGGNPIIEVTADNVKIKGVTVNVVEADAVASGIHLNGDYGEISNSKLINETGAGGQTFFAGNGYSSEITKNELENGIVTDWGTGEVSLEDNTFTGEVVDEGIWTTGEYDELIISGNDFTNLTTGNWDIKVVNEAQIINGEDDVNDMLGSIIAENEGVEAVYLQWATVLEGESIQEAINAADEGDTILVGPGTYEENVVVDVEGLTLTGIDGAEIESQEAEEFDPSEPAVFIAADNVTLDNIDLIEGISPGNDQDVVEIGDGVSGTHLLNLAVKSPDFTGIETGHGVIGQPGGAAIGDITIENVSTERNIGLVLQNNSEVVINNVEATKSGDDGEAIWFTGPGWGDADIDLTIENFTPHQNDAGTGSVTDVMMFGDVAVVNGVDGEAEELADAIFAENPEVVQVEIDGVNFDR